LQNWLPVARKVNQAQDKMVIKARFFGYIKDIYFQQTRRREATALFHYQQRLKRRALKKLVTHKDDQ
jgi:hypothetical protein